MFVCTYTDMRRFGSSWVKTFLSVTYIHIHSLISSKHTFTHIHIHPYIHSLIFSYLHCICTHIHPYIHSLISSKQTYTHTHTLQANLSKSNLIIILYRYEKIWKFMSKDFSEPKNKKAALTNAFRAVKKGKFGKLSVGLVGLFR